LKYFLTFVLIICLVAAIALRLRYGGGEPYPDLSTTPLLDESGLEEVLRYAEPIGNVAVSRDGRVFFTVHPESRPRGNRLLEWIAGAAVPFPSGTVQPHLFNTVLGVVIDRHERLWTIDHGNHGFGTARLLAFDLTNGNVLHDHEFRQQIAPPGSLLQDLAVSADGETVFIADASLWRKQPAIVVYDVSTRQARRVLESHASVSAENFVVRTPGRKMTFLAGLVDLKAGVDGITVDASGEWLYYGAINQSGLYRVRTSDLRNPIMPARQLEDLIERFSDKPLSDGLSTDKAGNIYVTDVEHGAVALVDPQRSMTTLVRSSRIRWADDLSFGPDGWLYIADSALAEQILQTNDHIRAHGPYSIFRIRTGAEGIPGH
jgi:sugar lactone lactonase YvrE